MIAQRRTYTQSMKQKKHAELSRGYGRPFDNRNKSLQQPMRPGKYQVTIEELKKRTRCNLCHEKGHWKRECPKKKDKTSSTSETHYLENDMFGSNEEAFFCGLLELAELTAERSARVGSSLGSVSQFSDRESAAPEQYMLSKTGLFMFENYFCDVVNKSPCISDESCATLDTGCQRLAIGRNTLVKLMKYIPEGLQVHLIPAQNTFRSVHGVSSTTNLAAIPCAIGLKGCYLRPALFDDGFGVDAPFLISLPFLLKTRDHLVLDQKHGLQLQMFEPKCVIDIHLGPSGALRIPLMQFDDEVLRSLKTSGQVLAKSEFEIFETSTVSCHRKKSCAQDHGNFSSSTSISPDRHHGGPCKQASTRGTGLQCSVGLEPNPEEVALVPDLPDDTAAGDAHSSSRCPSRGGDGRDVGDERVQLESHSGKPITSGGIPTTSRVLPNIEGIYDRDFVFDQCERHPRALHADRASTQVSLPAGDEHMDLKDRDHDKIFARCSRPRGQQCRFFQWYEKQPLDDLTAWRYQEDTEGNPCGYREILTEMIQDKCAHKNISKTGTNGAQEKKTCKVCQKVWITKKPPVDKSASASSTQDFAECQKFMEGKRTQGKK